MIAVFDDSILTDVGYLVKGTPLAGLLGETTLLSMLASTFYSVQGVIFPIIYIINFTMNALFDTTAILAGENYLWKLILLFVIGTVFYIASFEVFKRKNLPL